MITKQWVLKALLFLPVFINVGLATVPLPIAQTQQGIYVGRQITVNGININYWYGVPYAQQPIGNLRWMPPKALAPSNGTTDAFIPNACPQKENVGILLTESCLSLNVHAPDDANSLPVYVWIHGGSFTSGAGVEYVPTQFISIAANYSAPVLFVSINYRLGLLGFLADNDLYNEQSGSNNRSTTGNYGILDQMMALDWIRKNIYGFGGDPNQITIGGESAGGVSVAILLSSPLVSNDMFQRAIIQSGGIWPSATNTLNKAVNNSGNILRTHTNCTTLQCFRSLSVDQILEIQNMIASESIFGAAASPVIDGYVLNETMEESYTAGNFQRVPIIVGSTTNETSLFTCPIFKEAANITQVQSFMKTIYNDSMIDEIPAVYGSIFSQANPLTYLNVVFSDSWEHCGSRRIAVKFSSYGLPSYLYTYDHLIPVAPACFGVAHAAELPMFFPTLLPNLFPNYNFTVSEQQLSNHLVLYWANFVRTSNPNYVQAPIAWSSYTNLSDSDLVIDVNLKMRNHYYVSSCTKFWDQCS